MSKIPGGRPRRMQAVLVVLVAFVMLSIAAIDVSRPVATAGEGGKAPAGEGAKPPPTPKEALKEARGLLASGTTGLDAAAALLEELGGRDLDASDREDWLRLAREAAVRRGDRRRLEALRDVPDRFSLVLIYRILQASASLAAADFPEARALLARVGDPESLNEREKRRCHAILARLAQLEGNPAEERPHVEKLVDHLYLWPKPICQSCHATLSEPERPTHLKVSELWFGGRFVELMRLQGDAEKIRAESEARLAKRPRDDRARIRLAFALRALGRDDAALEQFRALPWADFPDRPAHKPRMMTTFP